MTRTSPLPEVADEQPARVLARVLVRVRVRVLAPARVRVQVQVSGQAWQEVVGLAW